MLTRVIARSALATGALTGRLFGGVTDPPGLSPRPPAQPTGKHDVLRDGRQRRKIGPPPAPALSAGNRIRVRGLVRDVPY